MAPGSHAVNVKPALTEMFQQANRSFATKTDKTISSDHTHPFSSMAATPGTLEMPLQVLDMSMVRKIKAELMEVDANSDGRYANTF